MADPVELLFFDTFSHESSEELNLDLVQFPKPVYVTEVRIIPLGARVQADFPGGVRLGATNPSQFSIQFFVNDLGKPGASTFESLGGFEYNQNGCIHLECTNSDVSTRQIPTDGLVLRGWYTTITLAVYGTLTKNITEQVLPQTTATPSITQQPPLVSDVQQIVPANPIESTWQQDVSIPSVPIENYQANSTPYQNNYVQSEPYSQDYHHMDYYASEPPKDPRFHRTPETDWDPKRREDRPRDVEHLRDEHRDPDRHYSRSHSRDRDRRDYQEGGRDRDWNRERSQSSEYREKDWDRSYKHPESYKRSRDAAYGRGVSQERDEVRKRPRTPPTISPKRPHTPHGEKDLSPGVESISEDEIAAGTDKADKPADVQKHVEPRPASDAPKKNPAEVGEPADDTGPMDLEQFEPILSDEDICDETEASPDPYEDFSVYSNNDDIIKLFNPLTTRPEKYRPATHLDVTQAGVDRLNDYFTEHGLAPLLELLQPCVGRFDNFKGLPADAKEDFVNVCEQLPGMLTSCEPLHKFVELLSLVDGGQVDAAALHGYFSELRQCVQQLAGLVTVGLDFELALSQNQPGYKIRHIKSGVRLVESCCSSPCLADWMVRGDEDLHLKLLGLFDREYMALSIKLLILRALDASLCSRTSIQHFVRARQGYRLLVNIMSAASSVRIKFALNSLLNKLNMYEVLEELSAKTLSWCERADVPDADLGFVVHGLEQVLRVYRHGTLELSQPKRFLPVSAQFEIGRPDERNVLYSFFAMHRLPECLLVLLTHPQTSRSVSVVTVVHELVSQLLRTGAGVQFLSEHLACVGLIMRCFFQNEDLEAQFVLSEAVYIRSSSLGLKLAYKLQCLYYVELLMDVGKGHRHDCDHSSVLDPLHALYSLTYVNAGKICCSEVLSYSDNVLCLLQFMQMDDKADVPAPARKSPAAAYIADLLLMTVAYSSHVPFLERHGRRILAVAQQRDRFEPGTAAKLAEVTQYLCPVEAPGAFSYDDVKPLCEVVNNNLDGMASLPVQVVTALRILRYLGISDSDDSAPLVSENCSYNLLELKYKYVILQLFSADGVANFTQMLQRICKHYEQPHLHTTTFVSSQGAVIMHAVLPAVQLLRQMLMHVVHCRNTEFKDLTSVGVLLQTFSLAHAFPAASIVYREAREVCREVVDTLLVYSQPVSDEVSENDSLNKTLWTLMSGEVIRYVTLAPCTFIPGLLVFCELLPLPLPIQTRLPLSDDEAKRAVNLRKLWSAHLHSHSAAIQELVHRLCTSVHQPLLHLLRRVCIQLADLAANSALVVARGVLDSVHAALAQKDKAACGPHTARLLHFLACLATHGAVKCALLQLLCAHPAAKADEKYPALVNGLCQVLRVHSEAPSHLQAQECVVNVVQNLCDNEISLLQGAAGPRADPGPDAYLANSLPPRDVLVGLVTVLVELLASEAACTPALLPAVRTLILLSEHDYGFYHLFHCLDKRPAALLPLFRRLAAVRKEQAEQLQLLSTTLEFLRLCLSTDDLDLEGSLMFVPRTARMNVRELRQLLGWKLDQSDDKHPLHGLEAALKGFANEEPLDGLLENVTGLIKVLSEGDAKADASEVTTEPLLPAPDSLLSQFASRPVYALTDTNDSRLSTSYWLSAPTDEGDMDSEHQVTCNLSDLCRQLLSADINLNQEVEKLIRVYPSEESERQASDQLKIKRAASDGQRGDKMKKPYVTPMRGRGFPRTAPQRGDLFRSRPPNTSRPPSLHVDDFVALETCGAQPTGPTGYNKLSRDLLNTRAIRNVRGRTFISPERALHFRPL